MTGVTRRLLLPCVAFARLAVAAPGQDEARVVERWLARQAEAEAWHGELSGKWDDASASAAAPVENLVLPFDHHANGRIRAVLRAERAQMLGENLVFARNVRVDLLLADGTPDGTLLAEDCLVDRIAKRGFSRGAVDFKKGTDHLKGRGMYFSTDERCIKILSECEIRTFRIPARFGRLS